MEADRSAARRFPYTFALAALIAAGCSGDGCSCVEPIPGGFPDEERVSNAVQVRVSDTGIAALESDPATLVGGLLGSGGAGGSTTFDVPPSCGGDTEICCSNGMPQTPCGPIDIDLTEQQGDQPRLEINPIAGQDQVDIFIRARVATQNNLSVTASGISCEISIDTTEAGGESIQIAATALLSQDADAGTTRIDVENADVSGIDNDDITLSGGFLCFFGDVFAKGTIVSELETALEDQLSGLVEDELCKPCDSGDVAECGPHADSCDGNVCMKASGDCLQEVGIAGRMGGASLLGSFSPGTTGKMDLYEVLGGYGTTEQDGIALGMLSGMLPAGAERDRCGPPANPPEDVTITQSSFFQGNTRPDTNDPFHFAVGVHQHNLDMAAWAAYDGGLLCLNIGTDAVDLLTSETLAVLMPSFIDLLHGDVAPMVLGLRPQSPPAIALGPGTFTPEGEIDEALLDVHFSGLEIDFFGMVDDQFIRLMTLTADVDLPVSLDVDANGEILPILGDVENAFTNLSVSNSEALAETPEELESKVPALLSLALPLIGDGLSGFALPELGSLSLAVNDITSVEDQTYLAIFGDFVVGQAAPAPRVETSAEIVRVAVPPTEAFRAPVLDRSARPVVELGLAGRTGDGYDAELEYSYRIDGGMWSPYLRRDRLTLSRDSFWLQGRHTVEVRAREVGRPLTADPTPVVLEPVIDTLPPRVSFRRASGAVRVLAADNVVRGTLRARYRWPGDSSWRDAGRVPAIIETAGRDPETLEVTVVDESGNPTTTSPGLIGFHGTASGDGGCECRSGGLPGPGALLLLAMVCLGLAGRRGRQRVARLARLVPGASLLLAMGAFVPGCSCGGTDTGVCAGETGECAEGEVERGPTGRWSDIAVGDRTVISAYEEKLGDLVLIEVLEGDELSYRVVDGIDPVGLPVYDPETYRGGKVEPGPNVGAWTSIDLIDGLARMAYQDIDAGVLKFAAETDGETFQSHEVDTETGGGEVGLYASMAHTAGGVPAIAYMAAGQDDGAGGRKAELRFAMSSDASPLSAGDWTVSVVDEVGVSCSGLCGDGDVCVAEGDAEVCRAPTGDCSEECGDDQACLDGACTDVVPDPPAHQMAAGVGLFANLAFLPDGRTVIVYYDRVAGDLVMQLGDGSVWERIELDATAGTDTGMFCDMVVDPGDGTVHVAYQDALGDQLLYTSWKAGTAGPIEVVDDGTREGDRPHNVGSGAAIFLTGGGQVAIAYQDGATADLVMATRSGEDSWSRSDLLTGATLDGFFTAGDSGGGTTRVSSYRYDRSFFPPGELMITTIP